MFTHENNLNVAIAFLFVLILKDWQLLQQSDELSHQLLMETQMESYLNLDSDSNRNLSVDIEVDRMLQNILW